MGSSGSKTVGSLPVTRIDHNAIQNGDSRTTTDATAASAHLILSIITLVIVVCVILIATIKYSVSQCTKIIVKALRREAAIQQ